MQLQGRSLKLNMKGHDVTLLQQELRLLRYVIPAEETQFGKVTRIAVLAVQALAGLLPTGIVDEVTAAAINRLVAQLPQRGGVGGRVTNQAGQPLTGVKVTVLGTNLSMVTGAQGVYKFDNVPLGSAQLQASAPGYVPKQAVIVVLPGQTVTHDFVLSKAQQQDWVVRGRVVKDTGAAVVGVKVAASQVVDEATTPVGEATSRDEGKYEIKYKPLSPTVHLRVKAFDNGGHEIGDSGLRKNLTADESGIDVVVATPSPADFVVKGRVRHADGRPLVGAVVRAFDKDLRAEEPLGESPIDAEGRFEIRYGKHQFRRAEKASADLLVRAFSAAGQVLAVSPIRFNAALEETLDLIVGDEPYRGPSEYERLVAEVTPLLDGVGLEELTEDATHQDISFLSGETGQDASLIVSLAAAHRLSEAAQLPAAFFYGLVRQGLPTELPALLMQSPAAQRRAIVVSAQTNTIPAALAEQADAFINQLKTVIVREALKPRAGQDGSSTLNELLSLTLPEGELREKFFTAYSQHSGSPEKFWRDLEARPEFRNRVEAVQRNLQFGALSGNHLPLVRELQRMQQAGKIKELVDLTKFDEKGWLEILAPIAPPPGIPGGSADEKARNYATALSHMVEDAFPTAYVTQRLKTDNTLAGQRDLSAFFDANREFDVRSTRLPSYLKAHPQALANVQDREGTKNRIRALQRIYKVAPQYAQASALLKGGVDSAHAVTRMGENVFTATFGPALGGKAGATRVYAKAQHVKAAALTLAAAYGPLSYGVEMQVLTGSPVPDVEGVPEWSTLFGSLELCSCEHCRSVYGPAAYLVDVLHFLNDRPSRVVGKKAKDLLFLRRPDLGEIELTCENTNTPLPYVDLVNEALENAVAPLNAFTPFNLPAGVEADLNSRTLSANLRNAFAPPLSLDAVITVGGQGQPWDVASDWWIIDEPGFTYTVRKENAILRVVARGLQTKGSPAERAANPQYVNVNAYENVLKGAVYPWSLPFDLWAEEARAYLDHLGVPRFSIMENVQPGDRAAILNGGALAREHLGLTAAKADIIVGATTTQAGVVHPGVWNLWGFEDQTLGPQNFIPDPSDNTRRITQGNWVDVLAGRVDVFLQQSGLTYKEMLDLLDTQYANPAAANGRAIQIVSTDANSPDTCETDKLKLQGLNEARARQIVRFVRLWRALGWSMRDLDRAITAFAPAALDDAFLTRLSHVQRLHSTLDVPVARLLSWWANLDTGFYIDHAATGQPRAATVYDELFRNRATVTPPDPAFTENPAALAGTLSGHGGAITAALGITATDFALLLADPNVVPTDALTLERLSQLHRHASLAKALHLSVRDYLAARQFIGVNPFTSTGDTVLFVEAVNEMLETGFTVAELDYLLRHAVTPEAPVAPADQSVAAMLDELRVGLRKIAEENTFRTEPTDPAGPTVDLNGELTRRKLALLNWDRPWVDQVIATLTGALTYETALAALPAALPNAPAIYAVGLAALPAGFAFPDDLNKAVAYDDDGNLLTATRLLSQPERDLLQAAAAAVGDAALTAAVAALFNLQDDLQGEISYDAPRHVLRFAGPMTNRRKARLDAVSGDAAYRAAVQVLYDAPRVFVGRAMRAFDVHDFGTDLAALPASVRIPKALKRKIFFDATTNPKRLHCLGVMSEQERDTLLALSTNVADPNHAAYQTAVNHLYALASALVPDVSDAFLTAADAVALFDAPRTPGDRFLHVLGKLLPYLRRALSERLAVDKTAETLQLEVRSAGALLRTWLASPADPARRCLAELLDPAFAESSTNVTVTAAAFPAQFRTFLRAHKAALIATRFKLTHRQLEWLFTYGAGANWLDLNALPTTAQEPAASFASWRRLAQLTALRDRLPQGERALHEILALGSAVPPGATNAEKNAGKDAWSSALIRWTRWLAADLRTLIGVSNDHTSKGVLDATFPNDYVGEHLLVRLRAAFDVLKGLGMSAQQASELATGVVTMSEARDVRQVVRAKYDEAQWLNLAKPLRDVLRERQRSALVAYLVTHLRLPFTQLESPHPDLALGDERPAVRELQQKLNAAGADPRVAVDGIFGPATQNAVRAFQIANGVPVDGAARVLTWAKLDLARRSMRDANDLYTHLLIDVEMDPCMMTSRIKQAISSVQLFVQRCLMNLEPDVAAGADIDVKWREWKKWMKNYRIWEANRKVFLYAENWIEPELRDDKSPFFVELEGELLQSNLSLETAEEAFLHYLAKLDQVARLEVVGVYHQAEQDGQGNPAVDILHVFARTAEIPHVYFYRQRLNSATWTAWERLDLDIEGDHLLPMVWNRRLYLFWCSITERARPLDSTQSLVNLGGETPQKYWEVKLAWSELKPSGWTEKRMSTSAVEIESTAFPSGPSKWLLRSLVDEYDNLHVCVFVSGGFYLLEYVGVPRYLPGGVVDYIYQPGIQVDAFRFDGCSAGPVVTRTHIVTPLQAPTGAEVFYTSFRELNNSALYLPAPTDTAALNRTPGTFLVSAHNDGSPINAKPFFFQDNARTFFVTPSEGQFLVWHWREGLLIDPGFAFAAAIPYWQKGPPLPDPVDPLINPQDPWISNPLYPMVSELKIGPALAPATVGLEVDVAGGFGVSGRARVLRGLDASAALASAAPELGNRPVPDVVPNGRPAIEIASSNAARVPGTPRGQTVLQPAADLSYQRIGFGWYAYETENRFLFQTFYHPYVSTLVHELNRNGLDGMLQRPLQMAPYDFAPRGPGGWRVPPFDFKTSYEPHLVSDPIVLEPYPVEQLDFEEDGAYSLYNWELFFHAPLMIADRLSKNQRYEEAQKWFHYIFDPTDTSGLEIPQRYWRTKPFHLRARDGYEREHLKYLLTLLAAGPDPARRDALSDNEKLDLARFENAVDQWRKDPFKPHLIARMRTTAYQKAVVMKYIDNLIAWADQLFRRDTIESINEATQLYVLAAEILGRRPEEVPPRAVPRVQTYNSLEANLDTFSNALVQIEEFVSPSGNGGGDGGTGDVSPSLDAMLYFCVPKNDKLLSYWDTVADRLFKIRHCMNIAGVVRQLPLFEPPIDPALLVRATAAGVDLSSVLNDVGAAQPYYRFNVLAQKATELCAELKSLGQSMLSALEKRDAEQLSLLRAEQETTMLSLAEQVRKLQRDEAERSATALSKTRDTTVSRYTHYQKLLGAQSPQIPGIGQPLPEGSPSAHVATQEEGGIKTIPFEQQEMEKLKDADDSQGTASRFELLSSVAHIVPNWNVEPWGCGATFGGSNVGSALSAVASWFRADAAEATYEGGKAAKLGQYALRAHDWLLQSNLAAREIMQVDQQILAAELRKQIAERELSNHRRQLAHAREVEAFLRDKYTNQELYGWMVGQLATGYFQTYQLAYDVAKRAERAFRHELGIKDSSFIEFGYWDSLKKGLLSGERLFHDVKRMEVAYLEQNAREYELTKNVSIARLDPLALVQLRQTGACAVRLPEALFDLDLPGHYLRRIKTVGVTIPCITGPYTGVHCTLTLLRSSLRHANTLLGGKYGRQEGDPRFTDNLGAIQSIVTSGAQNDGGLFETNLRDDRTLPFEGLGAISEWQIELPAAFRQFDYDTISDVILHVRYTARDAGAAVRQKAAVELRAAVNGFVRTEGQQGLAQVFSLRHEFPSEWYRFLNPPEDAVGDQTLTLPLAKDRFPFVFQDRTIAVTAFDLFVKVKPPFTDSHNGDTLKLSLAAGGASSNVVLAIAPWNGLLRATKPAGGDPGDWTLTAWLDDGGGNQRLDPKALEDIVLICRYTC